MYENMTKGSELKTPPTETLKFLKETSKLYPKLGVTSLFTKHTNTIDNITKALMIKLPNEANLLNL